MTENDVLKFARTCAATFCRRHGCQYWLDDATGEALLYLTANADSANTIDRPVLFVRVQRALSKAFRPEARQKKRVAHENAVGVVLESFADWRNDVAKFDDRDEARFLIVRAAINAGAPDFLPVFMAIGEGATQEKAAEMFGVSLRTLSRRYCRFAFELRKLDTERGVKLVEPRDHDGQTPLFNVK